MGVIIPIILKAVPWQAIFGIVIKLVFAIWDKNKKYEASKKMMLMLINEVDRQTPIKIRTKYQKDIDDITREIMKEEIAVKNLKKGYKAYEDELRDLRANSGL
ncbi:unnamed protein product, partial [marine sediment metagenome]